MMEIPWTRRFGGLEAVLIAVALAFAVSMTAWWHDFYQSQGEFRPLTPNQTQHLTVDNSENVRQVTVVAYLVNTTAREALPAVRDASGNGFLFSPPDRSDPNQALLLGIAVIGAIATAVYSLAIYPALRRLH